MISATQKLVPTSNKELVECFENLGDNCEFGIIQRYAGAEPPSLFRFNATVLERLIHGLSTRFSDLALPGSVSVEWKGEWMVKESSYLLTYHSGNDNPDYSPDRLVKEHTRWLTYMAGKFLERLEIGDRMYVRKGENGDSEASIRSLYSALRNIGPASLLWVTEADDAHPTGSVERLDNGLIRGWLSSFASWNRVPNCDVLDWLHLLRRVWALNVLNDENAFPIAAPRNILPTNFGGWHGSAAAISDFVWDIPQPPGNGQVMKHVRIHDTSGPNSGVFSCMLGDGGLVGGALYIASAYVWLPPGFKGQVGIGFHGLAKTYESTADVDIVLKWQRVWTIARLPDAAPFAYVTLYVTGRTGTTCYSAGWQLQPREPEVLHHLNNTSEDTGA